MTQEHIIALAKHVVKRTKKRQAVKIPAMSGRELDSFLRGIERAHGYS